MNNPTKLIEQDVIVASHVKTKRKMVDFKSRRFEQWNDNYALYRDKVKRNRITQRQAVNVPVIRETLKSWIANIDEPPAMRFKNMAKGNEYRDKDIMVDELWQKFFDDELLELKDQTDKKIVGLQGISFKEIGWDKEKQFPYLSLKDPYDVLLGKGEDPFDLQKHRCVKVINIFKSLNEIVDNEIYDKDARAKLKLQYATDGGKIIASGARESYEQKEQRLKEIGAESNDAVINVDDTVVELNISYDLVYDKKEKKNVRYYRLYAADNVLLVNKPIKDALGFDFIPMVMWGTDPDLNDVWPDGYADNVRQINKIINVYLSQDIENRGFRNFGMFFYNNLNGKFVPKGIDARPFGMYGMPGNPNDMMKQVEIQPLNDTNYQIDFLKNMAQASVSQTAGERGESAGAQTLGEFQKLMEISGEMNNVDTKHYRRAWVMLADMFVKILEAKQIGRVKLFKEGGDGEYRGKDIYQKDWTVSEGYKCIPVFTKEQQQKDGLEVQKTGYVMTNFAANPVALKIAKRKQLEALGWKPEDIEQVMQYEEQATSAQIAAPMQDQAVDQQAMKQMDAEGVEDLNNQM